jgi:hypothetical protein
MFMIPIQMTDSLITFCGAYKEQAMPALGALFGFQFRSNLTTVTDVIVRIKLNEQSADRQPANTNLLLEWAALKLQAV